MARPTETSALNLTDKDFRSKLREGSGLVAIEFWSFRSETSRRMAPVVSQIVEALGHRLTVFKVNVDDNPRIVAEYGIPIVPCLLIIKDGRLISSFAEEWSVDAVKQLIS